MSTYAAALRSTRSWLAQKRVQLVRPKARA